MASNGLSYAARRRWVRLNVGLGVLHTGHLSVLEDDVHEQKGYCPGKQKETWIVCTRFTTLPTQADGGNQSRGTEHEYGFERHKKHFVGRGTGVPSDKCRKRSNQKRRATGNASEYGEKWQLQELKQQRW